MPCVTDLCRHTAHTRSTPTIARSLDRPGDEHARGTASQHHVILVIFGDSAQTLDDLATLAGNTSMRTNVAPLLERPPARHFGAVIASIDASSD